MDDLHPITIRGFVRRFAERHRNRPDKPFCFVIGAGASRSSDIRTGEELVNAWLRELHEELNHDGTPLERWATAENLGILGFEYARAADFYPEVYERRFDREQDGFAFLEKLMEGKRPSFGYGALAYILERTQHKVVITTNFDNLIADALSMHSETFPRVVGHDELVRFVGADLRRPLVAKIHGDLGFAIKNRPEDLRSLPPGWRDALTRLLRRFDPIFIGHGGNDRGLMDFLLEIEQGTVESLHWCYRKGSHLRERVREVVDYHKGCLVAIDDFDLLMMQLLDSLGGATPDLAAKLESRSKEQLAQFRRQASDLGARLATTTVPEPIESPIRSSSSSINLLSDQQATLAAAERVLKESKSPKAWWVWAVEAKKTKRLSATDAKYREGISELPSSAPLLGEYAVFLETVAKDPVHADEFYRRAIEADPTHANNLGNYARFLGDVVKDPVRAEEYYKRSIDADPSHAKNLGNYARFLANIAKDPTRAEELYKRAIEADPSLASTLGNYAWFLGRVIGDPIRAVQVFKRAMDAEPNPAVGFGNYAVFLEKVINDPIRAEAFYRRAIEVDPRHAKNLGNYARFLMNIAKDSGSAEGFYKRAIEADPNNAANLGSYATFLHMFAKRPSRAGEFYERAIEADPSHPTNLGNFAVYLEHVAKSTSRAAEFYERAIEADPNHANNLGNYACFLQTITRDSGRAEELYKRAIDANPKDANLLGNYAGFLLSEGRTDEGLDLLDRAGSGVTGDPSLEVELAFYRTAHCVDQWPASLSAIKRLIQRGARSEGWPFGGNIERARQQGHPDPELLAALAAVITDGANMESLERFEAWRNSA